MLIAGEPGEDWVGSGRSVSSFDLHGALGACSRLLGRWGGHRAAAGLSIAPENVAAFAEAFAEYGDRAPPSRISEGRRRRRRPRPRADPGALRGLERLARPSASKPERHAPGGRRRALDLAAIGEGKHLRLAVTAAGARSGAIAFGRGSALDRYRQPGAYDVAFRLANHWNGTVTPQLVVKEIFETSRASKSSGACSWPNGKPSRSGAARGRGRSLPSSAWTRTPTAGGRSWSLLLFSPRSTMSPCARRPETTSVGALWLERVDVSLHALDFGGHGPPVLLLHGLAGYAGEWADTASWLSERHRVVAIDLRGHGESTRTPSTVAPEAFVADVSAWLDALGFELTTVVGQSFGGLIAFLTAARHRGASLASSSRRPPRRPIRARLPK